MSYRLPVAVNMIVNVLILGMVCLSDSRDIKIGLLSPFKHIRLGWDINAAAATMAIDKAREEGILPGLNISVIWRDDKCNSFGGAGQAYLLHDIDDVDVFVGPPCSSATEPAALLAAFWNIPMFSQASSDPVFMDKSLYKTLIRLGPPFNKMGLALVHIFRQFEWNRVVIVTRRKTDQRRVFCDYSSRSTLEEFRANNITVADWLEISDGLANTDIDDILTRIQQRGRIVILCTENTVDRRNILLRAYRRGMTDGSYVYFTPEHLPPLDVATPYKKGDANDADVMSAYKSVFQITVAAMAGPEVELFRNLIPQKMTEAPWYYNQTLESGKRGSEYSAFLHDVVYLYLLVLNETITDGSDIRNGTNLFEKAKGKLFQGITGTVKVDNNGDRDPDYWVWAMDPADDLFKVSFEARLTSSSAQKIYFLRNRRWLTANNLPPPDSPVCGFFNELCPPDNTSENVAIVVSCVSVILLLIGGVATFIYMRKQQLEKELISKPWILDETEIIFNRTKGDSTASSGTFHTYGSVMSTKSLSHSRGNIRAAENQVFSTVAVYRGTTVAVRKLFPGNMIFTRSEHLEMKAMRGLTQENVNPFIGVSAESACPCVLMAYCPKGSLQDIIENDEIRLDRMFKMSLLMDLANGMQYIHSSPLKVHGNLKSSNCVVDNRWVLRVTDYGFWKIRQNETAKTTHELYRDLFWTAPELLASPGEVVPAPTKVGDIYSYGIILYEVLERCDPYDTKLLSPKEIIDKIRGRENNWYRPNCNLCKPGFSEDKNPDIHPKALLLIENCWDEDPIKRPTFTHIKQCLLIMNDGRKINIMDNMISMLEKYANNLEDIVNQRTEELVAEKHKTDVLLYRMLPKVVAERLKIGKEITAELYDSATIYFSDIVGFTALSSESTALQIVQFLNDLYTEFDSIIDRHDVYKVETIGDAYMVCSGLPVRNGERHVVEISNMALDLLAAILTIKIEHCPDKKLQLRIGIHTGSCAAGVVGRTMPRFCLFGDTVNMASRMESNGAALKIHMSLQSRDLLIKCGGYQLQERGQIEVKGKGIQTTYWLLGKD